MILRFSVQNWMSYREKATFSMLAGAERQHSDHLARVRKYKMRVLPVAVLYGGNASGKTNLLAALAFARDLVVRGTRPEERIPVQPFLLDAESVRQPTRFSFELLIDETVFEYSFAVTAAEVVSEKLVKITTTSEWTLFDRRAGKIIFMPRLERDPFLHFAFRGTRDNELFLTNSVAQKVEHFRPVSDWFRDSLRMGGPHTRRADSLPHDERLRRRINEILRRFDTGIERLESQEIPLEAIPMPEGERDRLINALKDGYLVTLAGSNGQLFSVLRRDGRLQAARLEAVHGIADGESTRFDIAMESNGSRHLIELLPFFIELADHDSRAVCVIDELESSLHPSLSRSLVEVLLADCDEHSRIQLIFTTHDVQMMDQLLLRRDEMWVTERLPGGATRLYSFGDFEDLRVDTDLRRNYLNGKLGGVPNIDYSSLRVSPAVAAS
ncbi:MAG: ATP-binding protein [Bacteroidota bacterium]|nr:ATP-binding protein [Bacteroidota bacterium]